MENHRKTIDQYGKAVGNHRKRKGKCREAIEIDSEINRKTYQTNGKYIVASGQLRPTSVSRALRIVA